MDKPTQNDFEEMYSLILSYVKPCLISCAVKFDIVDHLSSKSLNAQELAAITNTNPTNLYRLLRALVSIGVLKSDENKKFSVTKFGQTLKASDSEGSMKHVAKLLLSDHYITLGSLYHAVETGETAFSHLHGKPFYDFLKDNREKEQIFSKAMFELTNLTEDKIVSAYDFSNFKMIVDVGGGHGMFTRYLLSKNPHLTGVVFDREYVIEKAKNSLTAEFGERCVPISGDFFESVPAGGDCYVLKHIVLNWKDLQALKLLRNVCEKMDSNTKLLIIESLVTDNNEPELAKIRDIGMMAMIGGILRTVEDYNKLLPMAGLRLNRVIKIQSWTADIIEVTKV